MDGWKFLELQQADAAIAAIPVVVYSSEPARRLRDGMTPNVVVCISKLAGRLALVGAIKLALSNEYGP